MKLDIFMGAALLLLSAMHSATAQVAAPLKPGDLVRLRIYREPDLSGDFAVNEHGNVTLPHVGDLFISNWPADSIRPRLTRRYAEFLRDPVLEVTLLRRVAIVGGVFKPGLYPVDPTMTVQDALALAGGPSPDGRKDVVEIFRNNHRIEAPLSVSTSLASVQLQSGDQLVVPQISWWARNSRILIPSLIGAVATVTAVLLRH